MQDQIRILSFDIEEWFHILDNDSTSAKYWHNYESRIAYNMDRIFRLLDDNKVKASFFCLGWIARRHPEIIKRIDDLGYHIGTHSDMHKLAYEQSPEEFRSDLDHSVKSLEDLIGKKVTSYRAPGFSVKKENVWVFDELIKQGIEVDCSVFPLRRSHGGFASFGFSEPCIISTKTGSIKEFPMSIMNMGIIKAVMTGGGYFRFFPLWLLEKKISSAPYVMCYFHPRDFDIKQPKLKDLTLFRKFKAYYGISGCLSKLDYILKHSLFTDIPTADKLLNWRDASRKVFK